MSRSHLGRLLQPQSNGRQELRVQLTPTEAIEACRSAIHAIGWEVMPGPPGRDA